MVVVIQPAGDNALRAGLGRVGPRVVVPKTRRPGERMHVRASSSDAG